MNTHDQNSGLWRKSLFARIRRNFLTGLVIVLPISLTVWMVWSFMGFVDDRVLPLIPGRYNPIALFDIDIRGMGLIIFLVFTTIVGAITKGIFGRQLIRLGESIVDHVPIVRSIYNGVKQIVETITNSSETNFDKVCMLEYPRKGLWAIGFISTTTKGEIAQKHNMVNFYSVFVPTTPNPTSGFLLFVPQSDVIILDMDVESAAKLIISAGIVEPPTRAEIESQKINKKAK